MKRERREFLDGRGYFVDEIYVEDEEEAIRLGDEEAYRSARMLGLIGCATSALIVAGAAFILWKILVG